MLFPQRKYVILVHYSVHTLTRILAHNILLLRPCMGEHFVPLLVFSEVGDELVCLASTRKIETAARLRRAGYINGGDELTRRGGGFEIREPTSYFFYF